MVATYNPAAMLPTDQVRYLAQDTGPDFCGRDFEIQDEEIAFELMQQSNPQRAALNVLRTLKARYARLVDYSQADMRESLSQRGKQIDEAIATLQQRVSASGVRIYAGGVLVTDRNTRAVDGTLVPSVFRLSMDAEPGTTITPDESMEAIQNDDDD